VPIHQARHEGSATAINHDGVLLTIRGHHRSDARNPAAFDENLACRRRSNIAGPDCAVGEQQPPCILFQDSLLSIFGLICTVRCQIAIGSRDLLTSLLTVTLLLSNRHLWNRSARDEIESGARQYNGDPRKIIRQAPIVARHLETRSHVLNCEAEFLRD